MSHELPPIPTPPALLWRQIRLQYLPFIIYLAGIAVAALLWTRWVAPPTLVGEVEAVRTEVRSAQAGTLSDLKVSLLQSVRAGQVVGFVAAGTPQQLAAALDVIRAEIDLMRSTLDPVVGQQRAALDVARLQLDWLGKRVDLTALQGQLRQAEINLERTGALHKTQMATDAQLDAARITRESLAAQTKGLGDLLAATEPGLKPLFTSFDANSVAGGLAAAVRHKEKELAQLEAQLGPQPLLAPIDGVVTAVLRRSGEAVASAEPILQITSAQTDRIVGFIRQPVAIEPKAGMTVEVRTRTFQRQAGVSAIGQVGNQLEAIPPSLLAAMRLPVSATPTEFGLRVVIPTPRGLPVRPGEQVDLIVRD